MIDILNSQLQERLFQQSFSSFIAKTYKMCLTPNCPGLCPLSTTDFTCLSCHNNYCMTCQVAMTIHSTHIGKTCEQFKQLLAQATTFGRLGRTELDAFLEVFSFCII